MNLTVADVPQVSEMIQNLEAQLDRAEHEIVYFQDELRSARLDMGDAKEAMWRAQARADQAIDDLAELREEVAMVLADLERALEHFDDADRFGWDDRRKEGDALVVAALCTLQDLVKS